MSEPTISEPKNIELPGITSNIKFGFNLAFVYFKELCISFIRHTMGYTEYYWYKLENKVIEEIYTEKREKKENDIIENARVGSDYELANAPSRELLVPLANAPSRAPKVPLENKNKETDSNLEEELVKEEKNKYEEYYDDDDLEEMPYEEFMQIHNKIKQKIEEANIEAEKQKKKEQEINKAADIMQIHNKIKQKIEEANIEAEKQKKKEQEINKAADIVYKNQFNY